MTYLGPRTDDYLIDNTEDLNYSQYLAANTIAYYFAQLLPLFKQCLTTLEGYMEGENYKNILAAYCTNYYSGKLDQLGARLREKISLPRPNPIRAPAPLWQPKTVHGEGLRLRPHSAMRADSLTPRAQAETYARAALLHIRPAIGKPGADRHGSIASDIAQLKTLALSSLKDDLYYLRLLYHFDAVESQRTPQGKLANAIMNSFDDDMRTMGDSLNHIHDDYIERMNHQRPPTPPHEAIKHFTTDVPSILREVLQNHHASTAAELHQNIVKWFLFIHIYKFYEQLNALISITNILLLQSLPHGKWLEATGAKCGLGRAYFDRIDSIIGEAHIIREEMHRQNIIKANPSSAHEPVEFPGENLARCIKDIQAICSYVTSDGLTGPEESSACLLETLLDYSALYMDAPKTAMLAPELKESCNCVLKRAVEQKRDFPKFYRPV
jgi:hypothetical protein